MFLFSWLLTEFYSFSPLFWCSLHLLSLVAANQMQRNMIWGKNKLVLLTCVHWVHQLTYITSFHQYNTDKVDNDSTRNATLLRCGKRWQCWQRQNVSHESCSATNQKHNTGHNALEKKIYQFTIRVHFVQSITAEYAQCVCARGSILLTAMWTTRRDSLLLPHPHMSVSPRAPPMK